MKRGQVALYIIIGMLLFIGIVVFFFYYNKLFVFIKSDKGIGDFVTDCVEVALMEAIYFNGLQGGYFISPNNSVKFDYIEVPVFYEDRKFKPISLNNFRNQLEQAVSFAFENCVGDFEAYLVGGREIEIERGAITNVSFSNNKVSARVSYPFKVIEGEKVDIYNSFSNEVNFKLEEKYKIVSYAMRFQEETLDDIPIVDYVNLAKEKGFVFEVIQMDEQTFIYNFEFSEEYKGIKYRFVFAARYNRGEIPEEIENVIA